MGFNHPHSPSRANDDHRETETSNCGASSTLSDVKMSDFLTDCEDTVFDQFTSTFCGSPQNYSIPVDTSSFPTEYLDTDCISINDVVMRGKGLDVFTVDDDMDNQGHDVFFAIWFPSFLSKTLPTLTLQEVLCP